MPRKKFSAPTTVFIACEGKNTEPLYFERIKEAIDDEGHFALTIYPDRTNNNHKSDQIGLVREAQSKIRDFDEVWVVYDKNGYTKHAAAVEKAEELIDGKKVHIAFSSIAFEQWILLHFEKSTVAFEKSEDVINHLTNNQYFEKYEKTGTFDTYKHLSANLLQAVENAAWLRFQLRNQRQPIHTLNPYTDVDRLVCKLLKVEKKILLCGLE